MLDAVLKTTGIDPQQCARLLGISPTLFEEWLARQKPIPDSYVILLSDILGVEPSVLRMSSKQAQRLGDLTPAIWFKLRSEELVDADRECVLVVRQLGHYQNEIEELTGRKAVGWNLLFEGIRQSTDAQAPPVEQGRRAARIFRESTGLSQCATGIGEVFRGHLRRLGILVIETPVVESKVEGCSFYVGMYPMQRPCVFANTYQSTWFRRNWVLLHEVAHAIFDAPSNGASIDLAWSEQPNEISEQRAQSFAQEALIPREVLHHIAQSRGIKWDSITADDVALLIAETHAEQRAVARAAVAGGFVGAETEQALQQLDTAERLREISERALTTAEFIERHGAESKERLLLGKRTTSIPSRSIRLPVAYIRGVIDALREKEISRGRAAELLMIEKDDLESRFGDLVPATADE